MMVDKDRYKAVVAVPTEMIHSTLRQTKIIPGHRQQHQYRPASG